MNPEIKKLGDVCDFYNGKAHEKSISDSGGIKVVNSKFVSSDGVKYKLTEEVIFPLFTGDICLVMSDVPNGKTLAKCFLVDADDTYSLNQRVCAIRTNQFDVKFLFYQLNRHPFLLSFNNGENQTNLRKADILNCPLWVPTIQEQKRIVALLDTVFADLEKTRAKTEQNLKNARELFDSYLQQVFSQKGDGWEHHKFSDLCELISGQHIDAKNYNTDKIGIGYLTGPSDFGTLNPIVTKWTEHPKRTSIAGDILITVKGSGVGKVNIMSSDELAISRQLMAVRPTDAKGELLYWFLSMQFDYFQSLANGAAIPGISRHNVLDLELSIPKLSEQPYLLEKIVAFNSQVTRLENVYAEKIKAVDELKKSILQKAFCGELTHK